MSHTSRQEALHSMRPLKQSQGPTAPAGEGYWDASYSPNEEVQGHRIRAPSWSLPANRSGQHSSHVQCSCSKLGGSTGAVLPMKGGLWGYFAGSPEGILLHFAC